MIGLFSPNLKGVWVPSTQHTVYLDLVHTVHTVPHNSHPHWVFVFLLAGEKGSVAGIWRPPCQRRGGEVPQVGQTVVISSNNIIMYKCSVMTHADWAGVTFLLPFSGVLLGVPTESHSIPHPPTPTPPHTTMTTLVAHKTGITTLSQLCE